MAEGQVHGPPDVHDEIKAIFDRDGVPSYKEKVKITYWMRGALVGLQGKMDRLRDEYRGPDFNHRYVSQSDVDHNIEQAQVSLEVAFMRLDQASRILEQRMAEKQEGDEDVEPG